MSHQDTSTASRSLASRTKGAGRVHRCPSSLGGGLSPEILGPAHGPGAATSRPSGARSQGQNTTVGL